MSTYFMYVRRSWTYPYYTKDITYSDLMCSMHVNNSYIEDVTVVNSHQTASFVES